MGQEALVTEEIDAGTELIRRLDGDLPVKAALWVKESENGRWYLYITSDRINDKTTPTVYGEILRLAEEINSPYLDPFQVKLIPTDDPLARAALDLYRRYPGLMATRFGGGNFGGTGVEGVYLYAEPVATVGS